MSLDAFVDRLTQFIIYPLIGLLLAAALLLFFWGLSQFVLHAGEEAGRETGRQHMIWGIVGILIMVSVIGILRIVTATFGVSLP
jgi:hypothetical protein